MTGREKPEGENRKGKNRKGKTEREQRRKKTDEKNGPNKKPDSGVTIPPPGAVFYGRSFYAVYTHPRL